MSDSTNPPIRLDKLVDARAMRSLHPETFDAPTEHDLATLVPLRSWVKVCRAGERFWIGVLAVEENLITGYIDNDLVNTANSHLKRMQMVVVEKRHCYDTHTLRAGK